MTQHQLTDEAKAPRTPTPHRVLRLSGTRRGTRLARLLAVQQFTEWTGLPHDSELAHAVALVAGELGANAIRHGTLPGRDFRLVLRLLPDGLRIEVTDTRPERLPPNPPTPLLPMPMPLPLPTDATSGRGLLLVEACADRWGCTVDDAYTKTIWAEISTHGHASPQTDDPAGAAQEDEPDWTGGAGPGPCPAGRGREDEGEDCGKGGGSH